jgi:hypothetical protein
MIVIALLISYQCHITTALKDDCMDPIDTFTIAYQFIRSGHDASFCPSSQKWLQKMHALDPSRDKVFVDIGFNKGYNFAIWSAIWLPNSGINPQNWFEGIEYMTKHYSKAKYEPQYNCGVCSDCKTVIESNSNGQQSDMGKVSDMNHFHLQPLAAIVRELKIAYKIDNTMKLKDVIIEIAQTIGKENEIENLDSTAEKIYFLAKDAGIRINQNSVGGYQKHRKTNHNLRMIGVDLNPELHSLVRNVTEYLGEKLHYHLNVQTIIAAGSNISGSTTVLDCKDSLTEVCKMISGETSENVVILPTISVDSLVVDQGLRQIDILLIDAEGHDPLVLMGGMKSFMQGKVRLLIFEYHEVCPWPKFPLKVFIDKFEAMGYICYFEGQLALWRITGSEHSYYFAAFKILYA